MPSDVYYDYNIVCVHVHVHELRNALKISSLIRSLNKTGQVETEETENGNGKLKRKTEAESGNGKAEIGKWSSTFGALKAPFAHARSVCIASLV